MRDLSTAAILLICLGLNSCIEQKIGNGPDNQIVVIGNGADKKTDWNSTVVADVNGAKPGSLQSLILENAKAVPVQEKLSVKTNEPKPSASPTTALTQSTETAPEAFYLGWIAPGLSEGTAIVKVSDHPSVETKTSETPKPANGNSASSSNDSSSSKCLLFEAKGSQVDCSIFETLPISDHSKPDFRKDGSVIFLDAENTLRFSFDQKTSLILSKNVKKHFFDLAESLFYQDNVGNWYFSPKAQLDSFKYSHLFSSKLISGPNVFYEGKNGNVFLYTKEKGVGLSESLALEELYQFNSLQETFEPLWKEMPPIHLSGQVDLEKAAVQGESLFLVSDLKMGDVNAKATVVELSSKGITKILPEKQNFQPNQVIAGPKNIYVTALPGSSPNIFGELCARSTEKESTFQCKTLATPEGQNVDQSILGGDQLILALSLKQVMLEFSPTKKKEDTRVVALNSDLKDVNFGNIQKTWSLPEIVKSLRFFDLAEIKTDNSAEHSPTIEDKKVPSE